MGIKDEAGLRHWADILVVVLYFILVLAVGFWSLWRPNRGSVRSYFLAGRSMTWFLVGASLFSSNIGSEHFVGLAGTGAASGIAIVLYEWFSMPLVLMLSWLFLPVYISAGVYTLPEYLQKRFGGQRLRIYLSVLAIILYIVTKLAVSIFAGALFIEMSLGWDMYVSIVALLLVTGIYTVLGGLAAVIYTDTLQTVIMTIGAFSLVGIGLNEVGGYNKLQTLYMEAYPDIRDNASTCGLPPGDAFHLLRHPVTSDQPWPGIILQASIGCLWYWCCDQVIVQRTLAAKTLSHAKGGALLAGYLKILPLFIMIWPGMISRALYPDEVGCVTPNECKEACGNPVGCSNIAYPKLVLQLMPTGLRGLMMAVMLSAIMSSLTSIFNSASTLFTMDLWRKFRARASERELLIVGRVFIVALCGLSILWIPLVKTSQSGQLFVYIQAVQGYLGTPIGDPLFLSVFIVALCGLSILWIPLVKTSQSGQLFVYIQAVQGYLGTPIGDPLFLSVFIVALCGLSILWIPLVKTSQSGQLFVYIQAVQGYLGTPIGALFLWAILWPRMNEKAAFWGIAVGHACGVTRMVLDFVYPAPECGEPETRPAVLYNVHYTYFSQLVLFITSLTIVVVSLMTKAPDKEKLVGMTWWSRFKPGLDEDTTEVEEVAGKQPAKDGLHIEEPEAEEEEDSSRLGNCRKMTEFVCGIPKASQQHESFEEEAIQKRAFLREDGFWRRVLNVNAATGLIVLAFLIGFFR